MNQIAIFDDVPSTNEPNESVASSQAPLFSVVIASYNYGHLIERAIDSVLNQSCQDFELLVVDDGSTDDTRPRLERYGDKVCYRFKVNGGQSSAYNLGAELASGQFIYILDADDELLPGALEVFSAAIKAQTDGAQGRLFYGGYISVSDKGKERVRRAAPAPDDAYSRLRAFLQKKLTGLKNGGFVIPRTAFKRIRYPEHLRQNTDLVFLGQAISIYPAVHLDHIVLKSHEHAQRVRKKLSNVRETSLRPVDALFDPAVIPEPLMKLKPLYAGYRLRSMARVLYLHGEYQDASRLFLAAFRSSPSLVLDLSSFIKAVKSFVYAATQHTEKK